MHKCNRVKQNQTGKGEVVTKFYTNQEDITIDSWRRKISFLQCDTLSVSKHSRTGIVLVNYSITQHMWVCVYMCVHCVCAWVLLYLILFWVLLLCFWERLSKSEVRWFLKRQDVEGLGERGNKWSKYIEHI